LEIQKLAFVQPRRPGLVQAECAFPPKLAKARDVAKQIRTDHCLGIEFLCSGFDLGFGVYVLARVLATD